MADIVRRDPLGLSSMREAMDRLFDDSFFRGPMSLMQGMNGLDEGTLAVDVSRKEDKILVRASLPGFKKEDIDIQLNEGVLSIKAEHTEEQEDRDEHFFRRERRFGSVSRRIALPGVVSEADVNAELKDGVLTITVNVPEQAKPKRIDIKAA